MSRIKLYPRSNPRNNRKEFISYLFNLKKVVIAPKKGIKKEVTPLLSMNYYGPTPIQPHMARPQSQKNVMLSPVEV